MKRTEMEIPQMKTELWSVVELSKLINKTIRKIEKANKKKIKKSKKQKKKKKQRNKK